MLIKNLWKDPVGGLGVTITQRCIIGYFLLHFKQKGPTLLKKDQQHSEL